MGKKKRTPFAVSKDNGLYVELTAVMPEIIALADGLSVTFFGNEKKAYLAVDDAIAWCDKERKYHNRDKYDQAIKLMQRFKTEFAAGKVDEQ